MTSAETNPAHLPETDLPETDLPETDLVTDNLIRIAEGFGGILAVEDVGAEDEAAPRLARILASTLGPTTTVTITLGEPVAPRLLASSSQLAQELDGLQMRAQEGPCERAWKTGEMVVTPSVQTDERWPRLAAMLSEEQAVSVLAVPFAVNGSAHGSTRGVLNAYSTMPDAFAALDVQLAQLMAFSVGMVLQRMGVRRRLRETADGLREALTSRSTIDQAKGILVARHCVDPEAAFEMLRERSQRENVKVRDLAQQLVDSACNGGPQEPMPPR